MKPKTKKPKIDKKMRRRVRMYLKRNPGITQRELSERFGISIYHVKQILDQGEIQTLKSTKNNQWARQAILDEIVHSPELSYKQIAEKYKVSKTTVYTIAKENNIQRKRGPKTNY
ncbi:MAG: winged helix-turn-helix domain-containing protein [Clostridiaceae bacterium]|nr:winged helix-turn-helix domain-containing protein [Clostridiaceae bacterium]